MKKIKLYGFILKSSGNVEEVYKDKTKDGLIYDVIEQIRCADGIKEYTMYDYDLFVYGFEKKTLTPEQKTFINDMILKITEIEPAIFAGAEAEDMTFFEDYKDNDKGFIFIDSEYLDLDDFE